jgi:hypothetical protein
MTSRESHTTDRLYELTDDVQPPTPIAKPITINPKTFVVGLYKAWKNCNKMDKDGVAKDKIGMAFYVALKSLFER